MISPAPRASCLPEAAARAWGKTKLCSGWLAGRCSSLLWTSFAPLPLAAAPRIAGARSELSSHAPVIADLHPGMRSLERHRSRAGREQRSRSMFFCRVDMPLLPAQFLIWMLRRAEITGALVTVPRINGWPQPLCAVYHRQLLGPITAALLRRRLQGHARGHCGRLTVPARIDVFDVELVASADPEMLAFSPLPLYRWFHNCNTPEDMAGIGNALVLTQ